MHDLGVVIGRFQVANLSDGHCFLIDHALDCHRNVVVLVGSSQEAGTINNPLNFPIRQRMIKEMYPQITVVAAPDFPGNNKRWSHHIDASIKSLGMTVDPNKVFLYGGRDSFGPCYMGEFTVVEIDSGMDHISGTSVRKNIGKRIVDSEQFRRGIIYATQNFLDSEAQEDDGPDPKE